jgi:hypothetical protein
MRKFNRIYRRRSRRDYYSASRIFLRLHPASGAGNRARRICPADYPLGRVSLLEKRQCKSYGRRVDRRRTLRWKFYRSVFRTQNIRRNSHKNIRHCITGARRQNDICQIKNNRYATRDGSFFIQKNREMNRGVLLFTNTIYQLPKTKKNAQPHTITPNITRTDTTTPRKILSPNIFLRTFFSNLSNSASRSAPIHL